MKKEVKEKQHSVTLSNNKVQQVKKIEHLGLSPFRKLSFNAVPRYSIDKAYKSSMNKDNILFKKDGRKASESKIIRPDVHNFTTNFYNRKQNLDVSTVDKEEVKALREVRQLLKNINSILLETKGKKDMGTQTSGFHYTSKSPSTLTINSILKDIAVNELFNVKPELLQNMLKNADSDLKRYLLEKIIHQYQYQFVIEEILIELRDQGIEVESYIYTAYEELGIKIQEQLPSSSRLLQDTEISEELEDMKISIIDQTE